jgi:hypothetical protein
MAKKSENVSPWKFNDDSQGIGMVVKRQKSLKSMDWVVNESIFQEKSISWYFVLLCITLIFAGLIFLITKDKITTGVIILCAGVFAYYAGHKPRSIQYKLDDSNLTIAAKNFSLSSFKSFFIVEGIELATFILIPQKRFSPAITLYSEVKDANKIVNLLSQELPLDKNREDSVDRLMRRINF